MRIPVTKAEFLGPLAETIDELEELASHRVEQELDEEISDLTPDLCGHIDSGAGAATGAGDLACMRLARTYRHVTTFFPLLESLNRAHGQGFRCR